MPSPRFIERKKPSVNTYVFGRESINVLRNGGLFDLGKVLNPSEAIKYWIELDFQAALVTAEK